MLSENRRVLETVRRLRAGDVRGIGELLVASHASMRDDYEISCPELDLAVDAALAAGAAGARMTGGGFGGSAIALFFLVMDVLEGRPLYTPAMLDRIAASFAKLRPIGVEVQGAVVSVSDIDALREISRGNF